MSEQLLRDPFYGQLVGSIAITTALADRKAQEQSQKLTDSQAKAVFHRVIRTLEGRPPKPKTPTSAKERLQASLYEELLKLRPTIIVTNRETGEKNPLPIPMFLKAMRAAKYSLERHRTGETGERPYLEHAHETLARVEEESPEEKEEENEESEASENSSK